MKALFNFAKLGITDQSHRAIVQRHREAIQELSKPHAQIAGPKPLWTLYQEAMFPEVSRRHPGFNDQRVCEFALSYYEPSRVRPNLELVDIISEMWNKEPPKIVKFWAAIADEEKKKHQLMYPNYWYGPPISCQSKSSIDSFARHRPGGAPVA